MIRLLKGMTPRRQFLLFMVITLTMMGMGSITAMAVGLMFFNIPLEALPGILNNPDPANASALMWMNNIAQFFTFIVPLVLFFLLFGGKNIHGLLLRKGGILTLLSPVLIFLANGIIDLSSKLNEALIPAGSWLEQQFKPNEELAERMTKVILEVNSTQAMVLAFISIAVIPAIFEEFAFRGVIQPLLAKVTKNVHAAIWITAALFSLIHMQFYGFLPRLLMGALLGYMVIWSGSIWASVLAHFVNNTLAFVLFQQYGSLETPQESAMSETYFYIVTGILFIALVMFFIRKSIWPWLSFEYLGIPEKTS